MLTWLPYTGFQPTAGLPASKVHGRSARP